MSDKFTQADADRIHSKWRGILNITMPGKIELVDSLGENIAEVYPKIRRNRYLIKLTNPDLRGSSSETDIDDDVCHELLHVLSFFSCPPCREADPLFEEVYEQFIDHMASVLVKLHRGQ